MAFRGKVVLITGASSGIGAATAQQFSKLGASLALTGRNLPNLEKVAASCKKISGEDPFIYKADLTNENDIRNLVDSVLNHFKQLNVLINNAGIIEMGSIENTSMDQYDNIFNTNLRSVYFLTLLITPHLIATRGSIVNVSSVSGMCSNAGVLAYSMSKSALNQFTKCVALELASKGVQVNSVSPGVVVTEIHKRAGMDEETYRKFLETSRKTHPLGRAGTAEEVAESISFLASNEAGFTTGANLPIDGGRHALGIQLKLV